MYYPLEIPTTMPAPDTYKDIITCDMTKIPHDSCCQGCGRTRWFAISSEDYKFCRECFITDAQHGISRRKMRREADEFFKKK